MRDLLEDWLAGIALFACVATAPALIAASYFYFASDGDAATFQTAYEQLRWREE